jgi:hypothetical protein
MRNLLRKRVKRVALLIGIVLVCSHPASANLCEFEGGKVVADRQLDTMRGGFITTSGLEVSIGITKALIVDNVVQAVSQLNIPNLSQMGSKSTDTPAVVTVSTMPESQSAGQSTSPAASSQPVVITWEGSSPSVVVNSQQTNPATVVQNLGGPVVVQNSKDGAEIRNVTILNATANSASMIRAINLSSRISQQMINAIH